MIIERDGVLVIVEVRSRELIGVAVVSQLLMLVKFCTTVDLVL